MNTLDEPTESDITPVDNGVTSELRNIAIATIVAIAATIAWFFQMSVSRMLLVLAAITLGAAFVTTARSIAAVGRAGRLPVAIGVGGVATSLVMLTATFAASSAPLWKAAGLGTLGTTALVHAALVRSAHRPKNLRLVCGIAYTLIASLTGATAFGIVDPVLFLDRDYFVLVAVLVIAVVGASFGVRVVHRSASPTRSGGSSAGTLRDGRRARSVPPPRPAK